MQNLNFDLLCWQLRVKWSICLLIFNTEMSLRTFSQTRKNVFNLFAVILLCLGYFNYVLITEPISVFFHISSLTGQILVNKFISICSCTVEIVKLTFSFFQILYEDSLIFFKDATEKFAFAIYVLKQLYFVLEEFGWKLSSIFFQVVGNIVRFLGFLQFTFETLKEGIHLTGSSIWRAFTNIPEIVFLNLSAVNEFIKNCVIELKDSVYKIQEKIIERLVRTFWFLFDFPFDAVGGLIIGTVFLAILFVKFRDISCFVCSTFLKLYRQVTSLVICLWSGRFLEQKTRRYIEYNDGDDEMLCIICQNLLKEIIIFPCKHLCLCKECSSQIIKNQPVCPVCRCNITGTLKVYI